MEVGPRRIHSRYADWYIIQTAQQYVSQLCFEKMNESRGGSRRSTRVAPPPLKLEKNMIFWRKIVIFHTKYPKNFRASLPSAEFF
jgi:hypothetical protein